MEKKNINRRKFLGTGLAAAASVTVGNTLASPQKSGNIPVKQKD